MYIQQSHTCIYTQIAAYYIVSAPKMVAFGIYVPACDFTVTSCLHKWLF